MCFHYQRAVSNSLLEELKDVKDKSIIEQKIKEIEDGMEKNRIEAKKQGFPLETMHHGFYAGNQLGFALNLQVLNQLLNNLNQEIL